MTYWARKNVLDGESLRQSDQDTQEIVYQAGREVFLGRLAWYFLSMFLPITCSLAALPLSAAVLIDAGLIGQHAFAAFWAIGYFAIAFYAVVALDHNRGISGDEHKSNEQWAYEVCERHIATTAGLVLIILTIASCVAVSIIFNFKYAGLVYLMVVAGWTVYSRIASRTELRKLRAAKNA